MKIQDGALESSARNWFGQFEMANKDGASSDRTCCYRKGTFFSWVAHCVRFKFSHSYRYDITQERQQILSELAKDSVASHTHTTAQDNVSLGRSKFNNLVSQMLRKNVPPIVAPDDLQSSELQAVPAWQQQMLELSGLRTDTVFRHETGQDHGQDNGQKITAKCKPPLYVINKVESSVAAGYVMHAPAFYGGDNEGEFCKRFLTYYTFVVEKTGEEDEKLFNWEAMDSRHFDTTQAYPGIDAAVLPDDGWQLRVPSERLIKCAAKLAAAVEGKTAKEAYNFLDNHEGDGSTEEKEVAKAMKKSLTFLSFSPLKSTP